MIATGSQGRYQWLETEERLRDVVTLAPQIVLNKFIAVTSMDSGEWHPDKVDHPEGWINRQGVGYSSAITNPDHLPWVGGHCCDSYYEAYAFVSPTQLGRLEHGNIFEVGLAPDRVFTFVNYLGAFRLSENGPVSLTPWFWKQLDSIKPETYLADGLDGTTVVTSNPELFALLRAGLQTPAKGPTK